MHEIEIIKMAIAASRAYLKESLLIILATAAGVFSIGLGQAIFSDTRNKILEKVNSIGKNCIYVFAANNKNNSKPITQAEFKTLEKILKNRLGKSIEITPVLLYRYTTSSTKKPFEKHSTMINCTKPDFFKVNQRIIKKGRQFNDSDALKMVCIVGSSAEKHFGKTVIFDGLSFAIIGVLEKTAQTSQQDPNEEVFIPFEIASVLLNDTKIIHEIIIKTDNEATLEMAIQIINNTFKSLRKTKRESEKDWTIFDQKSFRNTAFTTNKLLRDLIIFFSIITMFLCFIACVNSVFINIKARTKEFEILSKIGACKNIIIKQLFYELLLKFGLGAALGIPLCIASTKFMAINIFKNTYALELIIIYIAIIFISCLMAALKSIPE